MSKESVHHFTTRVRARSVLAHSLRDPKFTQACRAAGLLDADLALIQSKGEEAETWDRKQHEQLADERQDLSNQSRRVRSCCVLRSA